MVPTLGLYFDFRNPEPWRREPATYYGDGVLTGDLIRNGDPDRAGGSVPGTEGQSAGARSRVRR